MSQHHERKHSKFSASGAERWMNCPGSVELSENLPRKDSVWSLEGTKAHEVLENVLTLAIKKGSKNVTRVALETMQPKEMLNHAISAANFVLSLWDKTPKSELLIETRIHLPFIHPDMFGTFDGAVVDHFGTLDVIDYKYGAGHAVSPKKNLQMITYGMGLAAKYHWNFKKVRLWIIQPRIKSYDGPMFWEIAMGELMDYVGVFKKAVKQVEERPDLFVEGQWCHWCSAKSKCPLKNEGRVAKAKSIFAGAPVK